MGMPANNAVRFVAAGYGTSNFIVASAAAGYLTPEQAAAIDGKTYVYVARSPDGRTWETGAGAYSYATHTLSRTTISSTSTGIVSAPVNFAVAPIVDVFPSPSPTLDPGTTLSCIPSGTLMLFQQTTAPVGWTKITTHNDKALRVVSGAAGSGGANGFASVMAQTVVGDTTLSRLQIPTGIISNPPSFNNMASSANSFSAIEVTAAPGTGNWVAFLSSATYTFFNNGIVSNNTGGLPHNHTVNMNILYVDIIIASKSN